MHDWKQLVHKHVRVLEVCSPALAEELASHLEESYEASLQQGVLPEAALARTLEQVNRGFQIRFTLRILQEDLMTDFVRKIGLPGLLTLAMASALALVLETARVQAKTILLGNGLPFSVPPVAWLCLLPFCGAAGALASQRSGGSRLQRIAACLFPSTIMAAVLLFIFLTGFVISRFVPDSGWNWALAVPSLALWLTGQVILTAIPLLLGAAAAQRMRSRELTAN